MQKIARRSSSYTLQIVRYYIICIHYALETNAKKVKQLVIALRKVRTKQS